MNTYDIEKQGESMMLSMIKFGQWSNSMDFEYLYTACEKGDFERVKKLVQGGTSVKPIQFESMTGTLPYNYALGLACENGHIDVARYMLENGADILSDDGFALRMASQSGQLDMVKFLIEHGADATCLNNSAVRHANDNGHTETVEYLLQHGAALK